MHSPLLPLTSALFTLIFLDLWVYLFRRTFYNEIWEFWFTPVYCTVLLLLAGACMALREWGTAGWYIFLALFQFWNWYRRNRDKRRREAKRLWARVVDIGHRLVVRPSRTASD